MLPEEAQVSIFAARARTQRLTVGAVEAPHDDDRRDRWVAPFDSQSTSTSQK